MRIPIITMYGPWAHWVELGWKTIETRTHARFASLRGKRIGIHVAQKWDNEAMQLAWGFMNQQMKGHIITNERRGAIICTAFVLDARKLGNQDSRNALIDCGGVNRSGLILIGIESLHTPIYLPGKQGIWYAEVPDVVANGGAS